MRKNTSKFSSRSPTVEVTGLWDFENAWIPDDFKLEDLKGCIEDALQKSNPAYVIRNKIIAVGPGTGDRARAIRNCHRDFKLKAIPKANLRCDYQGCREFVVRRDGYEHEQLMRKTDTADKFIIKKLFLKVLDQRKNFLVITGDVDFSASLATLKNHNINVMLALHENSRLELFDSAAATWIWRSNEDRDVDTMLKKGRPITRDRLRNRARNYFHNFNLHKHVQERLVQVMIDDLKMKQEVNQIRLVDKMTKLELRKPSFCSFSVN